VRPTEQYVSEKATFAAECRRQVWDRKLIDRMGRMASGEGSFSRVGPKFMHEVSLALMDRGFGRPAQIVSVAEEDSVIYIKRVIGVNGDMAGLESV
jgi:hypothetical protein